MSSSVRHRQATPAGERWKLANIPSKM